MSGPSGLFRYLTDKVRPASRMPSPSPGEAVERPKGDLIWLHIGPGSRAAAHHELGKRLAEQTAPAAILVTSAQSDAPEPPPCLLRAAAPGDSNQAVRAFLQLWSPSVAILAGSVTAPAIPAALIDKGVPACLVDAALPASTQRTLRWTPGLRRAAFPRIGAVLVRSPGEVEAFAKLGVSADRIEAIGTIEEGAPPLPVNEAELTDLAGAFAGRPTWLAAGVTPDEEDAVIGAHQRAAQYSHRLLLVLVPSDPARGLMLSARLEERGWRVALRSEAEEPAADCQVYIADTEGEDGLWYRLCPVTYLGGSLAAGGDVGRDPCGPATLGSALLFGPPGGAFAWRMERFLTAGAARRVTSEETLGAAVAELLAPDRTAEIARRAWDITSEGAAATDRVIRFVRDALEERGGS